MKRRPAEERFWEKVDKSGDCWLWFASTNKWGYGQFSAIRGQTTMSHRYSFEIVNGPIPDGMLVLHSCDVPACVNPAHLRIGTPQDNVDDMYARGRNKTRSNIPIETIKMLREKYSQTENKYGFYSFMARKTGLDTSTVRRLVIGKKKCPRFARIYEE